MKTEDFIARFKKHPAIDFIEKQIKKGTRRFKLSAPATSGLHLYWAAYYLKTGHPVLWVASSKEDALLTYQDIQSFVNRDQLLYIPASFKEIRRPGKTDAYEQSLRFQALEKLVSKDSSSFMMITYPESILEKWPEPGHWKKNIQTLSASDFIDPDFLNELLFEYEYERTDIVTQPGEFALRGGIIDVFPRESTLPFRIEFRDEKIHRIRTFDIETQLTGVEVKQIQISIPPEQIQSRIGFKEILPANTRIFWNQPDYIEELARSLPKEEPYVSLLDINFQHSEWENELICFSPQYMDEPQVPIHQEILPPFKKNFKLFLEELSRNTASGIQNIIAAGHHMQEKRLRQILNEYPAIEYDILPVYLYTGFKDKDLTWAIYPERQIFDKPPKKPALTGKNKKTKHLIRAFDDWQKGDYIVHQDYGIGVFEGLVQIERAGKPAEVIKLRYKNDDVLYVSIHSLYKLSKYRNKDGKPPKIYRLGSPAWNTLKQKTKKRVKKLAFDLLKLYAERKKQKGFAFGEDSVMQLELESSFMYEDTPDQKQAVEDVKKDMMSDKPMDRIVCGDVGFGKTEVAIRAAFKAVDNGKQVAVLVPTTILAFQHYRTFSQRLKHFPVTVDYINRFRTAKEKKRILQELEEGKIDIIIGTHALVSDKVKFKDLGLLIIDEEHKFGVNIKEKIKNLKKNIDVLTLTATPIPRTLQFSLMGERDLSLIRTAPPNRYPIHTIVTSFSPDVIEQGIRRELERGGQVFFVQNRIKNLEETARFIQQLVPEARIAVAHGKTQGKELEKIMLDFSMGKYDILISTAIVESGLDVPNANTMFVLDAHQFGLADLHQLRGRVGRSNRQAYCYFIIPSYEAISDEARKRMQVLESFTELGGGFEIAMKDLEIRGAGDLLGAEQSGFINELGFDLYQKILQEAVEEVKQEDFQELETNHPVTSLPEVQLISDEDWHIPQKYIPSGRERLFYYQKLAEIKHPEEIQTVLDEMENRFGSLPEEVNQLAEAIEMKLLAARLGFEKVVIKNRKMLLYFSENNSYITPEKWNLILRYIQQTHHRVQLKKKNEKQYYLLVDPVKKTEEAWKFLKDLNDFVIDPVS